MGMILACRATPMITITTTMEMATRMGTAMPTA
jgi:hypothetical protein